jgi:hypothetical protein
MNKPEREGFVGDKIEDEDVDATARRDDVRKAARAVRDEEPEPRSAEEQEGIVLDGPEEPELPEWPMTIPLLHKAIETKPRGDPVKELTFREPSAGDIIRAGGNPCKVEIVEMGGGRVTWQPLIDDAKMLRLMASLSGVIETYLQRMDPRDYASCAHRLRRFFLPEQGIW